MYFVMRKQVPLKRRLRYSVRRSRGSALMQGMGYGMDSEKTPRQTLTLLLIGTLLAGCGALIVGGAPAGGHDTATAPRGGGETSRDTAITSSITTKYINDPLVDALAIRVTTYQGVVTLQGAVRSQAAATRAVELARATAHVRRVVSRLTVSP
jgi:hyperosmotically inducible periplasmic protein